MSETSKTLGVVGMKLMGDYSAAVRYKKLQVVTDPSTGDSYASKVNDNIGNALSNTTYWFPLTRTGAAVTAANNAASNANDKAALANTKAGLANDAAALANQKAGLANDAASNANDKAALANTKAGLANDAAALANQKAGAANDAAALANQKAGAANDAATLAQQKAGLADEAATAANNAAQAANTAATEAGRVDIAQSKSGKVISITTTNRNNQQTTQTVTEPTLEVEKQVKKVILTATDADGETSVEFEEIDDNVHQEKMSVGTADALRSEKYVEDKVPYNFRKAICASKRAEEMLVGGTVAWNQLVQNGDFASSSGWGINGGTLAVSSNEASLTADGTVAYVQIYRDGFSIISGHKYIAMYDYDASSISNFSYAIVNSTNGNQYVQIGERIYTNKGRFATIGNASIDATRLMFAFVTNGNTSGSGTISNVQIIDLTRMFGSTIADAIYAMEQANPGSGVAWFRNLFPKDYYAYDAGSLQSVQAASKKTVGKNLIDYSKVNGNRYDADGSVYGGTSINSYTNNIINFTVNNAYRGISTDLIRVEKGKAYTLHFTYDANPYARYIVKYDSNKNLIGRANYNNGYSNTDAYYIRIYLEYSATGTYMLTDLQLEESISYTGFEPYQERAYPFDPDLVLRGIPKLDSNNRLYYDGDTYESSGKVTRKYGIVNLGTLPWGYDSPTMHVSVNSINGIKKPSSNGDVINAIVPVAVSIAADDRLSATDTVMYSMIDFLYIRNSGYTDAAAFKTAMSGVYLVYELATPTTEQADPFSNPMICDPEGTEEFVEWGTRDVAIPVGHITHYLEDLAPVLNNIPVVHDNQTNQAVASFSDGAEGLPIKQMQIAVEPVQDLHGYDHPWPGGGGKNLLGLVFIEDASVVSGMSFSHTDSELSVKGTAAGHEYHIFGLKYLPNVATNTIYTFSAIIKGSLGSSQISIAFQNGIEEIARFRVTDNQKVTTFIVPSEYDSVRFILEGFTIGAAYDFSAKLMIEIGDVASPTFEPYSNICPITGWTGAKVTRTGKNLWDGTYTNNKIIRASNGELGNETNYCATDYIRILPNTKYYMRANKLNSASQGYAFYDKNKKYISGSGTVGSGLVGEIATPANACYVRFSFAKGEIGDTCFNYPSSDTAYNAYEGKTCPIPFPSEAGTVYGGTLTVNKDGTGTLVVDEYLYVYDGTETFLKSGTALNGFYNNLNITITPHNWPKMLDYSGVSTLTDEKSSMVILTRDATTYRQNYGYCYIDTGHNFNVSPETFGTTVESFKAKLAELYAAGTPVSVYCKLATPVTYTFTAEQIKTLLGLNNIWADTGDILSVDYPADTKLYIEKQIAINSRLLEMIITANHENGMVATKPYSTGNLLIVSNKLYKASASIANGAALTEGTNVTVTTVAAEIAALA